MSELFVIGYPDVATAQQVRDRFIQLQSEQLITLDDIVVVENQNGKIKLHQARSTTGTGAAGGALWGGLIGLLFFAPLIGMAVGAGAGALAGKATDLGIDDKVMKDLATTLEPGSAAVFVLVAKMTQDKVLAELTPYGGTLLRSSLSADAEKRLRDAAQAARSSLAGAR